MKRNSALLSFYTSPIFLLADLAVVIAVNFTSYKNDSVWTDRQLNSWFLCFFVPTFFMTMLSAWSIYKKDNECINTDHNASTEAETCMGKLKQIPKYLKLHVKDNFLSDIAIIGMVLIVALHSVYVPRTNSYLFGYITNQELMMFEGRTDFEIESYCKNNICKLNETNLHIRNKDYRKLDHLDEKVIYVDVTFNVTTIPGELRIIEDALDWSNIKTKSGNKNMCKRCLPGSNPQYQRCVTLSLEGGQIGDCDKIENGRLGLDLNYVCFCL